MTSPVKTYRQRRHWTQRDLARKTGLSPSTIAKIELGQRQPSLETLRKLAKALRCLVVDLVEEKGPNHDPK
jgi:transcriptional regulator with XRE-family HTH domain